MPIGWLPKPLDLVAYEEKVRAERRELREEIALLLEDPEEWQRRRDEALLLVGRVLARPS